MNGNLKKRYSPAEKITILSWMFKNGKSAKQTSKKFEVSLASISKWTKEHPEICTIKESELLVKRVELSRSTNKLTFEEKYYRSSEAIMKEVTKRLLEIIPQIESPQTLLAIADKFNPNAIKGVENTNQEVDSELKSQVRNHLDKIEEAFSRIKKVQGEFTEYEVIKE